MYLYVLYIEPLVLRFKERLHGVTIAGANPKVGAHVDDQILYVEKDEDIGEIWGIIDSFEKCTNSLINKSKTKLRGLGDWKSRNWLNCKSDATNSFGSIASRNSH